MVSSRGSAFINLSTSSLILFSGNSALSASTVLNIWNSISNICTHIILASSSEKHKNFRQASVCHLTHVFPMCINNNFFDEAFKKMVYFQKMVYNALYRQCFLFNECMIMISLGRKNVFINKTT